MQHKSRAFTLIELLVVVLIIGILAAVAVPQYQKAVNKSKVMQLVVASKAIQDAQKVYYLENNSYAMTNDKLTIDYPRSGTQYYQVGKGNCDVTMTDRVSCTIANPTLVIQREYDGNSLTCCSYSTDNFAGEEVCKLLKPGVKVTQLSSYIHCYY